MDSDNTDAKSTLRKLAHPHTGNKTYHHRRHNIIQAYAECADEADVCVHHRYTFPVCTSKYSIRNVE